MAPPNGGVAGRHLVEQRAGREDVAACIGGRARDLFRRQIGVKESPASDGGIAGAGVAVVVLPLTPAVRGLFRGDRAGRTELQQLHVAVVGDEDVRRFQVRVDEAAAVSGGQRVGELEADVDQPVRGERAVLAIASSSARPSSSSQTRNGCPFSSPESWTAQMCGWVTSDAIRASRRNRSSALGPRASLPGAAA